MIWFYLILSLGGYVITWRKLAGFWWTTTDTDERDGGTALSAAVFATCLAFVWPIFVVCLTTNFVWKKKGGGVINVLFSLPKDERERMRRQEATDREKRIQERERELGIV